MEGEHMCKDGQCKCSGCGMDVPEDMFNKEKKMCVKCAGMGGETAPVEETPTEEASMDTPAPEAPEAEMPEEPKPEEPMM